MKGPHISVSRTANKQLWALRATIFATLVLTPPHSILFRHSDVYHCGQKEQDLQERAGEDERYLRYHLHSVPEESQSFDVRHSLSEFKSKPNSVCAERESEYEECCGDSALEAEENAVEKKYESERNSNVR